MGSRGGRDAVPAGSSDQECPLRYLMKMLLVFLALGTAGVFWGSEGEELTVSELGVASGAPVRGGEPQEGS